MAAANDKIEIQISANSADLDRTFKTVIGTIGKLEASSNRRTAVMTENFVGMQKSISAVTEKIKQMDQESAKRTASMSRQFSGVGSAMIAALSVGGTVAISTQIAKIAEEYQNVNTRLKLVTGSSQELAVAQDRLYQLSQETGTSYKENASTYTKLAIALKDSKVSGSELIKINEAVSKSLVVSGASTEDTTSFLLQFGQAMGSGVLQGDELRAMLESNSYFAQQLAKALKTDIAGLRKMGSEGKLTTEIIRRAIPAMLEQINQDFAKMPLTIGRAMTMLDNAFGNLINDSNTAANGTGTIAKSIVELATTIDQNRAGIVSLFTSIISLSGSTIRALANIGQSIAGWQAVGDGRLKFLQFATMDAKELNDWLKKNSTDMAMLDNKISQLKSKQSEVAGYLAYSPEARKSKDEQLEGIRQEIAALELQKKISAGVAESQKRDYSGVLEWGGKTYQQLAESSKKSADEQKQAQAAAVDEMKNKYKTYADDIKRLQEQILSEEKSLDQQLREMKRTGMSEPDAWADKKKQAEDYAVVAKAAAYTAQQALENGETARAKEMFQVAAEYSDMAKKMYGELNTEVKNGDQIIVSQADALKTAMKGVEEFGKLKQESLKGIQEATASDLEEFRKMVKLEELTAGMDAAEKKWLENWEKMRVKAMDDIKAVEDRLVQIKDKEVTVWVNEKVRKQEGGMIQHRLARGGKLPGYGGGDRVPALLESGEFVIRKEAVARFGAGLFSALNNLRLPDFSGFSLGGMATAGAAGGDPPVNITLNYSGGGSQSDAKRMADMVFAEISRRWRGRS